MARDLSPPGAIWAKVISYLLPFEDWMHVASVCRLFREQIQMQHWARMNRLAIDVVEVSDGSVVEFSFDVKGTWHQSVLPKEKFLQLMQVVAKRLGNLKEICIRCRACCHLTDALQLLGDFLRHLFMHSSSRSVCKLEIVDAFGVPSARRYNLPALAQLVDKFSSTLTELRLPISAEVAASIANCHRLQKLTIEQLYLLMEIDGTEQVLMRLLTGKRELKVFEYKPLFDHLPGLSQALLATSAQLEALSFNNASLLNEYWALVRQLPNHPLKTVTRLEVDFKTIADFEKIMDVCPNLNMLIAGSMYFGHSHLRLHVARAFLNRYSGRAGDVRQLVMETSRPHFVPFDRDAAFQFFVEQSAQLTNSVVMLRLEEVPAEVIICRQNAIVHIRK